jgi:hypothetical protein
VLQVAAQLPAGGGGPELDEVAYSRGAAVLAMFRAFMDGQGGGQGAFQVRARAAGHRGLLQGWGSRGAGAHLHTLLGARRWICRLAFGPDGSKVTCSDPPWKLVQAVLQQLLARHAYGSITVEQLLGALAQQLGALAQPAAAPEPPGSSPLRASSGSGGSYSTPGSPSPSPSSSSSSSSSSTAPGTSTADSNNNESANGTTSSSEGGGPTGGDDLTIDTPNAAEGRNLLQAANPRRQRNRGATTKGKQQMQQQQQQRPQPRAAAAGIKGSAGGPQLRKPPRGPLLAAFAAAAGGSNQSGLHPVSAQAAAMAHTFKLAKNLVTAAVKPAPGNKSSSSSRSLLGLQQRGQQQQRRGWRRSLQGMLHSAAATLGRLLLPGSGEEASGAAGAANDTGAAAAWSAHLQGWVQQPGIPLVTLSRAERNGEMVLEVSQQRYCDWGLIDNQTLAAINSTATPAAEVAELLGGERNPFTCQARSNGSSGGGGGSVWWVPLSLAPLPTNSSDRRLQWHQLAAQQATLGGEVNLTAGRPFTVKVGSAGLTIAPLGPTAHPHPTTPHPHTPAPEHATHCTRCWLGSSPGAKPSCPPGVAGKPFPGLTSAHTPQTTDHRPTPHPTRPWLHAGRSPSRPVQGAAARAAARRRPRCAAAAGAARRRRRPRTRARRAAGRRAAVRPPAGGAVRRRAA